MSCQTPIIVALDFPNREAALALADQLDPQLCRVKVGKELFTRCGPFTMAGAAPPGWRGAASRRRSAPPSGCAT